MREHPETSELCHETTLAQDNLFTFLGQRAKETIRKRYVTLLASHSKMTLF